MRPGPRSFLTNERDKCQDASAFDRSGDRSLVLGADSRVVFCLDFAVLADVAPQDADVFVIDEFCFGGAEFAFSTVFALCHFLGKLDFWKQLTAVEIDFLESQMTARLEQTQ